MNRKVPCPLCGVPIHPGSASCYTCAGIHVGGPQSHAFKTGRWVSPDGYVFLSGYSFHLNANKAGQIAEHRLVMSQSLGRPLHGTENVHHRNGIRHDNRLENLELWDTSQPKGQRIQDKIDHAVSTLEVYAPHLLLEFGQNQNQDFEKVQFSNRERDT